jgi:hypothetical protein
VAADVAKAVYSLAVGSGDTAAYETVQKMYEQVSRKYVQSVRLQKPILGKCGRQCQQEMLQA